MVVRDSTNLSGSKTLQVDGYRNGAFVATDLFTLTYTGAVSTPFFLENAANLNGLSLDQLRIRLQADLSDTFIFYQQVDNINLTPVAAVATPEPSSLALVGLGLGALFVAFRSRGRLLA